MNGKQICRILFLFAICSMLIDGLLAQSTADIAGQEQDKKKEREKIQHKQEREHPVRTSSTPNVHMSEPKVSGNENVPRKGDLNKEIPLPNLVLLVLGFGLSIVGGLWFLIVAFKTSIGWGLGCLFIPFASLVYLVKYWEEVRWPFVLQVVGLLVLWIAVALG